LVERRSPKPKVMTANAETSASSMDGLKWLVILALIIGGAFANSYYGSEPFYLRLIGMIVVGGVAAFLAINTAKGQAFWNLVKEAQVEVRKVVWPTPAEVNQTTLLVVVLGS